MVSEFDLFTAFVRPPSSTYNLFIPSSVRALTFNVMAGASYSNNKLPPIPAALMVPSHGRR